MNDVRILKTADHMEDGFDFLDVSEELIAEAFTLGSAGDKSRDVIKLYGGGRGLFGIIKLA